jgi:hypothetical protein
VRRNAAVLTFRDAELLAEKAGVRLSVTCLGGEVTSGDVKLTGGFTATLSDDGFSRPKATDRGRRNALVSEVDDAFVLLREDFSADPAKRIYCGELKDGVLSGGSKETAIGFELPTEFAVRERGYVRMRIRIHGSKDGMSIGFGSGKGSEWRYFQSHHEKVANEEWVILRVPLSQLKDDGNKKALWPGVMLHKFQIVLWTKEGSSVDVVWFELGVDPEWNVKERK